MFTIRRLLFICMLLVTQMTFAADIWLNPAPYPEGMDTWYGTSYNTSAQHDYRLRIGGWGDSYNTLLRFDLSGLPQVAEHVYIWLYPINEGVTTDINWYIIGKQWQSSTLTFQDFPMPSNVLYPIGSTSAPIQGQWYRVEIPVGIYNAWRAGTGTNYKNHGFFLTPVSNNNNYSTFGSSQQGYYGPHLQVTYTPQANDNVIKLKWPLGTAKPASPSVGGAFGDPWGSGVTKCVGLPMTHAGVDIPNAIGNPVYAAEDGVVREVFNSGSVWASAIVLEHNHPTGGKYTTVYWHVNPVGVAQPVSGQPLVFIPKGMQIATIANITGGGSHLHIGVRIGVYNSTISNKGALPTGSCIELPTFRESFINPWDTNQVLFQ
jgi:murein DD-endopeptidase MepM/ murein hydrolase activator NlpD